VSASSVHTRVKELVDTRYVGKVQRAAKAWGVPQPTLRRIYRGLNVRPSADALSRIAQATGTTVEWLLTGAGSPPRQNTDTGAPVVAEAESWGKLLMTLVMSEQGKDPNARAEWRQQISDENEAFAVYRGLAGLVDQPWLMALVLQHGETSPKAAAALKAAAIAAMDAIGKGWFAFFTKAIDILSAEVVWQRLRLEPVGVALRFSDAFFVLREREDLWPGLLTAASERMSALTDLPRGTGASPVVDIDALAQDGRKPRAVKTTSTDTKRRRRKST
jgi:transcriptional regulator with XRE-family HTH domain